jgi:PAS domain S-box-containing protein
MIEIDLRTIYFSYALTSIVSLIVVVLLWKQSRGRFEGSLFWVIDFALLVICLLLISFRGEIPDFFSMVVSNTLAITGAFMGLIGLEHFTGKRIGKRIYNIILIALFFIIHIWFSLVATNLAARNLLFSVAFLILSAQCAWLLLVIVPANLRRLTYFVGIVFVLFCMVNIFRIAEFFFINHTSNDYFNNHPFEIFVIISYQILFIFLTFSLILMFNGRLLMLITNEEEKFSTAFHSAPYAILLTRLADGRIFEVNDGFQTITGYKVNEVIGKTTLELNLWNNSYDREKIIAHLSSSGKVKEIELQFRKKSGEVITGVFYSDLVTINNEMCILSVVIDVTDRKNLEDKLKEMIATKDKFFSIIAHDLKNPFSAILGFSELLKDDIKNLELNEIEQYSGIINTSAKQSLVLLENLLEWALTQKDGINFEPKMLVLNKLLNETIAVINENAHQKNIEIVNKIPLNIIVSADENMIKTLFRNILGNAVKYSKPEGKVEITAIEKDNEIQISVTDTGVGIKEEDIAKLFNIGSAFSTRGTLNEKGTGLGLILCKEFVEKHAGRIWVESELGKGSTFSFCLPVNTKIMDHNNLY